LGLDKYQDKRGGGHEKFTCLIIWTSDIYAGQVDLLKSVEMHFD